jgi:2-polyprenyl-3-methyl-5-hydroxy-6-metoxy-1,4-benzoquinol methylase
VIREEIIKRYARDKEVLDVGAVGQTGAYNLWDEIKPVAKELAGIDIMPSNIEGVVQGDMETYFFGRKFDVIVLGDIIEHVNNQGMLLDNIRKHLKEGGVLIITTPNAKWPTVFLPTNKTHTLWHDRSTLETLLKRFGFRVKFFSYYYGNKKKYNMVQRLLTKRQAMFLVCVVEKIF